MAAITPLILQMAALTPLSVTPQMLFDGWRKTVRLFLEQLHRGRSGHETLAALKENTRLGHINGWTFSLHISNFEAISARDASIEHTKVSVYLSVDVDILKDFPGAMFDHWTAIYRFASEEFKIDLHACTLQELAPLLRWCDQRDARSFLTWGEHRKTLMTSFH